MREDEETTEKPSDSYGKRFENHYGERLENSL